MRTSRIIFVPLGLLVGLSIHACASARSSKTEKQHNESDATGHWVQDAQLRRIMDELESLAAVTWPQELEPEMSKTEIQRRLMMFSEAQSLAEGLAQAADEIPRTIAKVEISEADRRGFLALVETLREQAQRLGEAARTGDDRRMEWHLNAINETCVSCHERFRDFSGPIDRG